MQFSSAMVLLFAASGLAVPSPSTEPVEIWCPEGQQYTECGSACPSICGEEPPICPKICVQRCECNDGLIFNSVGACVAQDQCGN